MTSRSFSDPSLAVASVSVLLVVFLPHWSLLSFFFGALSNDCCASGLGSYLSFGRTLLLCDLIHFHDFIFFCCIMTPLSFRFMSNNLFECISPLTQFRKHHKVASSCIPPHAVQVWGVFPSTSPFPHSISRAFSSIVSH